MCVLLITRLLWGVERSARKPVNHTSWVAVVTPTDRPKSVRNCCLNELFVALFKLSLCPFGILVGVRAFVIGQSQISFLSLIFCWYRGFCHRTDSDIVFFLYRSRICVLNFNVFLIIIM